MKTSKTILILRAMENGETLSNIELSKIAGWRFGGYLFNLREYGVTFTKEQGEGYIEYWTIENIPTTINYSGDRIKLTKLTVWERLHNLFN